MTQFTEHRLGDVARVTWGDTNTTKASYKERGFTAYSAAGPDGFLDHFDYDSDGIVLSAIGANCGGTWFASGRWSCIKNTIVITKPADGVDMRYLFYVTNDPAIWPKRGAAQPFISQTDARAVPVRLPPLPTQQRIAAILSAYDDLIENNTRRIAILEEMARRLYEEWFVHFRFPGHEEAEFRTSDAGDTPAGWPISRLEELVQINPRTSVPSDGFKPFVPMGSLSETNMVIGPVEQRDGNSGTKFQNNDTLVARITPCLENGKTGFVDFLTDEQPVGFGSTEFIVLRSAVLGRCAIYCLARSHAFRDVAIKSMSGSEGRQRVRPDSVKSFLVARPPTALLDRFEDFAWPCFRQVSALAKKNVNLRAQRDMLLAKLISGEIDVTYTLEATKEAAE